MLVLALILAVGAGKGGRLGRSLLALSTHFFINFIMGNKLKMTERSHIASASKKGN